MQEHADLLCGPKSGHEAETCDVLNIGFGMGIFDSYVQSHRPKTHTIVEAHPAIQKKVNDKLLLCAYVDMRACCVVNSKTCAFLYAYVFPTRHRCSRRLGIKRGECG